MFRGATACVALHERVEPERNQASTRAIYSSSSLLAHLLLRWSAHHDCAGGNAEPGQEGISLCQRAQAGTGSQSRGPAAK